MHVFITGASGYAGGAIAGRAVAAGHRVTALARTDAAAATVHALGAEPVRGDLADGRVLQAAAGRADAIVHAAVDYADPGFGRLDGLALDALLAADTPIVGLSTTLVHGDTGPEPVDESRPADPACLQPFKVEAEARVLAAGGTAIRPGLVHGRGGNLTLNGMLAAAIEHGAATYIGDGAARWSCVHVDDLADLTLAALERPLAGETLHAAAADAPSMREIAEAVGALAGAPVVSVTLEEATAAMGPFAVAFTCDLVVDSGRAEALLGWAPRRPGLLDDLRAGSYGAFGRGAIVQDGAPAAP